MPRWADVRCVDCGHLLATVRLLPGGLYDPPDYQGEIPAECPECGSTRDPEWDHDADEPDYD